MKQQTGNKRRKRAGILYGMLSLVVILLNLVAWNSTTFCDAYIKYVFPVWVNTYGRFTGLFPFSVGEILLLLGVCSVVLFVLLLVVFSLTKGYYLIHRKKDPDKKGMSGLWRFSKGYFCWFAWVLLIVCLIMTLNCTILYHASTFSEHYYGEEEGEYTLEDLTRVRNLIVERCNELSLEMERDDQGYLIYDGDLEADAIKAMQKLGQTYDQLDGYYPRPKPLAASDFFSQQYICGYYFPFSMEANYNKVMYIMNVPNTLCHELAHLRGYIYEDEATFIAYLACAQSGNKFFEYSACLNVLYYLDNDYFEAVDWDTYLSQPGISPLVYFDDTFLFEEDWDRINEEAVVDTETVDEISDAFTDTTLKLNGVEDGIISYNRVVELLLWYYDNQ